MIRFPIKVQRNEYAKAIRKQYELHQIFERRCNLKDYTVRTDGISNTLSTVEKDTYLVEVRKDGKNV